MNSKALIEILSFTDEPMELYKIYNESTLLYRITDIERIVRSSKEYQGWVTWKKNRYSQKICKELNINTEDYDGVYIEQDHFPITIFDIIFIIGNKMLASLTGDQFLTIFDIASIVVQEHLDEHNHIGTVSLTTTFHQLRHNGVHHLKLDSINGDYQHFLDKYRDYIPEAVQDRIDLNLQSIRQE